MDTDHELKRSLHAIPAPSGIRERSRLGIEQAIAEQQAERPRRGRRLKRTAVAIAAAAAVLFLSASLVGHNAVWAAIQRALQFVPGIGIVKEGDAASARYVLKQPISLSVGHGSVIVTGIVSDEEMTYITMAGEGVPRLETVKLVNEHGREYTLSSSTASWGAGEWTSGFWYEGKLKTEGSLKLIMDLEPTLEVPVTLSKAEAYASYAEMGETDTRNGVSITAVADRVGGEARISLVARHSGDFAIHDYGIHGVYLHDEKLKLHVVDDTGKRLDIRHVPRISSPAGEFYFELAEKEGGRYTLTLPEISVTYNGEAKVRVPTEKREQVDQSFEVAGFPVTITRTEKVADNVLRVYMDFHYDESAPASLYNLGIDRSSSAKLNERTGVIEYMEFEVKPDSRQVTVTFNRPAVVLRGPWQFEFSDEHFKTP